MIINIGQGIDNLYFGLSNENIQIILGEPDKEYVGENDDVHLEYFEKNISLKLEKEADFKLGWIECKNSSSLLFGKALMGKNKSSVLEFIRLHIKSEPEIEDFGALESYTYIDEWMELQFEIGHLCSINIGAL